MLRCQRSIEVDVDAIDQRLDLLNDDRVHCLKPFRMGGHVADEETEDLSDHRIVPSVDSTPVSATPRRME